MTVHVHTIFSTSDYRITSKRKFYPSFIQDRKYVIKNKENSRAQTMSREEKEIKPEESILSYASSVCTLVHAL